MLTQADIKKIKDYSVYSDWYIAFDGKSAGNRHLFRVAKIAKYLAIKEDADVKISVAGAWIHDIGLIAGNDSDPKVIKSIAMKFLNSINLDQNDIIRISECAEAHEGEISAASLEAKIVHDSDVIDKTGFLGVIRHTWKIVNLISPNTTKEELYDTLYDHLFWRESRLYTNTAKHLSKFNNKYLQDFFKDRQSTENYIAKIMVLAKQGKTTEQIADILSKQKDSKSTPMLNSQLKCDYLT